MSHNNLYTLSNKIRTILLTAIDKEILMCSKKNHLLINSQSQEQLMQKFESYRNFAIESEESFEAFQDNDNNDIFYDLRCNYSDNKFNFCCYSSRTSNECLYIQNSTNQSLNKRKNDFNSRIQTTTNIEIQDNNFCQFKLNSGKKLITKKKSSFSCKEIIDLKNLVTLNNHNNNHIKQFSFDFNFYSGDNKNDDSSKLLNYCYKLKKPNDEIINEILDDDTPTNKEITKNPIFPNKMKNNERNIPKKKLKKTIHKKKTLNKINCNNDDESSVLLIKKYTTNLLNDKLHYNSKEKSNQKEKNRLLYLDKKPSSIELKEIGIFHEKKIFQTHYHDNKSPEKKSKGKKSEQSRKSFSILETNKKPPNKKKIRHFNSIDETPLILIHKEKKEKKDKNNTSISVHQVTDTQLRRKNYKRSKTLCRTNNVLKQNDMFCFGKKNMKNYVNKRNESTKNDALNYKYTKY